MDDLGLYAQILYPNAAGFGSQKFADVKDDELRRLCASIYNEGMIEIQEISGGRLLPMALLPWWDIDGSVAEAHRAAASGFHGITMCSDPQNRGLPDLGERVWDPLWEVLSEEQLSVNFHIGASQSSMTWFGDSPWPSLDDERKLALGSAMMYLSNARVIANIIYSGVLERFPDLKIVSVESGVGWIPFFLEALDYQRSESMTHAFEYLTMQPSDYFRRQIYGCFWFEAASIPLVIDSIGVDNLMFETDYPHPTCLYPDPLERVAKALDGISRGVAAQAPARQRSQALPHPSAGLNQACSSCARSHRRWVSRPLVSTSAHRSRRTTGQRCAQPTPRAHGPRSRRLRRYGHPTRVRLTVRPGDRFGVCVQRASGRHHPSRRVVVPQRPRVHAAPLSRPVVACTRAAAIWVVDLLRRRDRGVPRIAVGTARSCTELHRDPCVRSADATR